MILMSTYSVYLPNVVNYTFLPLSFSHMGKILTGRNKRTTKANNIKSYISIGSAINDFYKSVK